MMPGMSARAMASGNGHWTREDQISCGLMAG